MIRYNITGMRRKRRRRDCDYATWIINEYNKDFLFLECAA